MSNDPRAHDPHSYPPPPPAGGPVFDTPPTYSPQGYDPAGLPVKRDDTSIAVLAHLSTIVSMIISVGWLSFVGPLVVWFLYKDRSGFVRRCAAGAFNFNVSMWIVNVIGWILTFTVIGAVIGIPMLVFSFVMQLWCHIRAAIKASNGEVYGYPMQLRILG